MAQDSWNYSCTVGGDARAIAQEDWQRSRAIMRHSDRTLDGVVYTKENNWGSGTQDFSALLIPSNPGGNTVRIANGAALVNGFEYYNDDDVDFDVSGGQANATDLIVLRSTPATGLVRLAHVQASAPATTATVTQDLTTWEIAIAEVLLDAGGNFLALTDVRKPCLAKGAVIPLEAEVGTGASGTFTFSGIPSQIFTDLRLSVYARSDGGVGTANNLELTLNNDGGANYNSSMVLAQNATVTHSTNIGVTSISLGQVTNAGGAASTADGHLIHIFGYSRGLYSPVLSNGMTANAGTGATVATYNVTGWWLNTAVVNRVDLNLTPGGNFTTDSKATLYGIV